MNKQKVVDVKVRLNVELHKRLKAKAAIEERSMNYLINRAVKLMMAQEGDRA
ncbi:toxin-antitoxin system HicB family antitoxin [Acinetobacter baumannii]|nr:toxin-antitoxin system HicB family antitoxin [Acinetobacter baumannii]